MLSVIVCLSRCSLQPLPSSYIRHALTVSLRSRSVHVRSHPVPFGHSYPSFAGGGAEPRPGGAKEGVTRGG